MKKAHSRRDPLTKARKVQELEFFNYLVYVIYLSISPHLHNNLQGSCQQGQLILRGYDQMVTNGKLLRQAYLYDGSKYTHDQAALSV
jgi:hypothetical protein